MRFKQAGVNRANVMLVSVILVLGLWLLLDREQLKKAATLKAAEVIGNIAVSSMLDDVAGGFIKFLLRFVVWPRAFIRLVVFPIPI